MFTWLELSSEEVVDVATELQHNGYIAWRNANNEHNIRRDVAGILRQLEGGNDVLTGAQTSVLTRALDEWADEGLILTECACCDRNLEPDEFVQAMNDPNLHWTRFDQRNP